MACTFEPGERLTATSVQAGGMASAWTLSRSLREAPRQRKPCFGVPSRWIPVACSFSTRVTAVQCAVPLGAAHLLIGQRHHAVRERERRGEARRLDAVKVHEAANAVLLGPLDDEIRRRLSGPDDLGPD